WRTKNVANIVICVKFTDWRRLGEPRPDGILSAHEAGGRVGDGAVRAGGGHGAGGGGTIAAGGAAGSDRSRAWRLERRRAGAGSLDLRKPAHVTLRPRCRRTAQTTRYRRRPYPE